MSGSEFSSMGSSCSSLSSAVKGHGEIEVAMVLAKLAGTDESGGDRSCCGFESVKYCHNINSNNNNNNNDGNNSMWGGKRKRTRKRVRTDSEPDHLTLSLGSGSGLNLGLGITSTVPLPFDLNVDQAGLYEEECENISFPNGDVKFEEVCESTHPGPARCPPQTRGRSRHNLTEAEKEARRIKRVLANRESARQTIRRRQAMYEELIQRAANLASENEKLKKNKEMVVKEFQSLQSTNHTLKEQMSQSGENEANANPSSTSGVVSANSPLFVYNTPSPALNLCQFTSSNSCMFHKTRNDYFDPANWCIFPQPWIFPIPPQNAIKKNDTGLVDGEGQNGEMR